MSDIHLEQLGFAVPNGDGAGPAPGPRAEQVLVVGVDDWAIAEAAAQLTAAGRQVRRCSESADAPFPCNAMIPGRGCPLDVHRVDVVLDMHSRPRAKLQLSEMGVVCGLRDGLPLVIGGISDESILAPWAEQVPVGGDIVSTCDAVCEKRVANTGAG